MHLIWGIDQCSRLRHKWCKVLRKLKAPKQTYCVVISYKEQNIGMGGIVQGLGICYICRENK